MTVAAVISAAAAVALVLGGLIAWLMNRAEKSRAAMQKFVTTQAADVAWKLTETITAIRDRLDRVDDHLDAQDRDAGQLRDRVSRIEGRAGHHSAD